MNIHLEREALIQTEARTGSGHNRLLTVWSSLRGPHKLCSQLWNHRGDVCTNVAAKEPHQVLIGGKNTDTPVPALCCDTSLLPLQSHIKCDWVSAANLRWNRASEWWRRASPFHTKVFLNNHFVLAWLHTAVSDTGPTLTLVSVIYSRTLSFQPQPCHPSTLDNSTTIFVSPSDRS